jgi:L-rhamnonate dehydratase
LPNQPPRERRALPLHFRGEPGAENGCFQLDDNAPGLGLTRKTEFLDQFNIIE